MNGLSLENTFVIFLMVSLIFINSWVKYHIIFPSLIFLLGSATHQYESAIGIHVSPPSWIYLPLPIVPNPPRLSQGMEPSSLHHTANSRWLSILHVLMCMFQCYSLNLSHPLRPPLHSQVCSLSLWLHCYSANRLVSTIFLDSIYIPLICDICFSLSDLLHFA